VCPSAVSSCATRPESGCGRAPAALLVGAMEGALHRINVLSVPWGDGVTEGSASPRVVEVQQVRPARTLQTAASRPGEGLSLLGLHALDLRTGFEALTGFAPGHCWGASEMPASVLQCWRARSGPSTRSGQPRPHPI
jgi:hypothetical protein